MSPRTVFIHRSHGLELNVEQTLTPWKARYGGDERNAIRRLLSGAVRPLLARHSFAIAREADGHIVSSTIDADFLADRLSVSRARIAVIPQAAPDAYVTTPAPGMSSERMKRVLQVSQFAFVKAPMISAAAIDRLAARRSDLQFTWVCDRAHHGAVRASLGSQANARLELLHWMPQDELRTHYDRSGVFLFPSFFEGFGKAFLEAMSRGLCVVATDVGGMHDVVEHGRTGVLVPPGDAVALADAALVLAGDLDRSAAMSQAAATSARAYTWERVGRETADFYRARLETRR